MGVSIDYELSVDNEAKIDRIKESWEKCAEELDLAGIPHKFVPVDGIGCAIKGVIGTLLWGPSIRTFDDFERSVKRDKFLLVKDEPSIEELMEMVAPGVEVVVTPRTFDVNCPDSFYFYDLDESYCAERAYVDIYPFSCERDDPLVRTREYVNISVKGFYDTPERTGVSTFSLCFTKLPRFWFARGYVETQAYTEEEVELNAFVHMLIVDFLKTLEMEGLVRKICVSSDGNYYRTGDVVELLQYYWDFLKLMGYTLNASSDIFKMFLPRILKRNFEEKAHEKKQETERKKKELPY